MKQKIKMIAVSIIFTAIYAGIQLILWNILQKNLEIDQFIQQYNVDHVSSYVTYGWINLIVTFFFTIIAVLIFQSIRNYGRA